MELPAVSCHIISLLLSHLSKSLNFLEDWGGKAATVLHIFVFIHVPKRHRLLSATCWRPHLLSSLWFWHPCRKALLSPYGFISWLFVPFPWSLGLFLCGDHATSVVSIYNIFWSSFCSRLLRLLEFFWFYINLRTVFLLQNTVAVFLFCFCGDDIESIGLFQAPWAFANRSSSLQTWE